MKKLLWILLILGAVLVACSGPEDSAGMPTLTEESAPLVTPYATYAPVETQAPTPTSTATLTPPPLPTPTPFIHIVSEGQTMIGIAGYYGVSLDALGVANPEVNPNFLSVGTALTIPLEMGEEGESLQAAAPEVLALTGDEVQCTPNRGDGMWCFWPVTNSLDQPVENVAGLVHLYDREEELLTSQPAYSLINLLKPGETVVLGTYFKPPVPDWQAVQGQITSAAAANRIEDRYLGAQVSELSIQLEEVGELAARVSGTVSVTGLSEGVWASYVWVLAMAYDDAGQVVGLRRWEAPEEASGASVDFDFMVYSAAGAIDGVEILAEAQSSEP